MKYKFWNIGEASASVIMAMMIANPQTAIFAQGFLGKILFFVFKIFCTYLANLGLIVMNVTAAKIETISDAGNFDESWNTAENLIKRIRDTGRELTEAEMKEIDDAVIVAFKKFATFGKDKKKKKKDNEDEKENS